MISAWMAYAFLVAAFGAAAAWSLERLIRSHRRPVRWVWFGGMAISALWPVWSALRPETEPAIAGLSPGAPIAALEPLTLQVSTASIWMVLDRPLLILWVACSVGLLFLGLGILARTRSLRAKWRGDQAGGRDEQSDPVAALGRGPAPGQVR